MIADDSPLDARTDVQGAADLIMGLTAAAAGGMAGVVVGGWGYHALALCAMTLAGLVLFAAYVGGRHRARCHGWTHEPHRALASPTSP